MREFWKKYKILKFGYLSNSGNFYLKRIFERGENFKKAFESARLV